jgi:hypothetical protein
MKARSPGPPSAVIPNKTVRQSRLIAGQTGACGAARMHQIKQTLQEIQNALNAGLNAEQKNLVELIQITHAGVNRSLLTGRVRASYLHTCRQLFCSGPPAGRVIRGGVGVHRGVFKRPLQMTASGTAQHPPRSCWRNGCCEALIASISLDCIDHLVILGERPRRNVLRDDAPVSRIQPNRLRGGLHHHNVRT